MTRNLSADAQHLLGDASALFREGRSVEAAELYRRLLAIEPNLPESWFNLAILERRLGQPDEALRCYDRALEYGVSGPEEAHLHRGVILAEDKGDGDAAMAEYRAALALQPRYAPALINLGNLYEDFGEWDEARAAYAQAYAIDAGDPLVVARLIGVSEIERADDPLMMIARGGVSDSRLPALARADLGFAVGSVLDRLGDYDTAFDFYTRANDASRAFAVDMGFRYDRAAQERLIDRIIEAFPLEGICPSASSTGNAPIFICGMFRSGSTLIEQLLAGHSRIVAGGELEIVPRLAHEEVRPYPEAVANLSPQRIEELKRRYLEAAPSHTADQIPTDKRPDNFLYIGLIKAMFPDARIIHTHREARDNHLSVYFLHAAPELAYATDLADIAHYDEQHRRLMDHWRALYPDDIVDVSYDALVADPAPVIAGLLDFCGLSREEAALGRPTGRRQVRTASHWQVRQPLYSSSSGRWRNYAAHLPKMAKVNE